MDALFENQYTRDKETMKEVYGYYYFKQRSRVILYAFSALLVGGLTALCVYTQVFPTSFFLLWLWVVLFFALQLFSYHRSVSLIGKRDLEMAKGDPLKICFTVSDTEIGLNTQMGAEYNVALSSIKHVVQTKNTIVLFSHARLLYIFRRDAFTVGDSESFLAFLSEKGLKIKK